jgi:hypothetical protein
VVASAAADEAPARVHLDVLASRFVGAFRRRMAVEPPDVHGMWIRLVASSSWRAFRRGNFKYSELMLPGFAKSGVLPVL